MDTKREYYLWTMLMVLSYVFVGYLIMEMIYAPTFSFYTMVALLSGVLICNFTTNAFLSFHKYK